VARRIKIALIGNPNSGKSTVFNDLTGLNQKVANFPGVTVEQKTGSFQVLSADGETIQAEILDLPGTYSLYPKSPEEELPFRLLCNPDHPSHPDLTIVTADGTNLKRNLFLCSQVIDLGIPVILVINMMDLVRKQDMHIDFAELEKRLGIRIIPMNARKKEGLGDLKAAIAASKHSTGSPQLESRSMAPETVDRIRKALHVNTDYNAFLVANNLHLIESFELKDEKREQIRAIIRETEFQAEQLQARETLERYKLITTYLKECVKESQRPIRDSYSYRIDQLLTHRVWGYFIFLGVLFLMFQSIFTWASYPMDLIDSGFNWLNSHVQESLPPGLLNDLIVGGLLAGINGIVVFVPQIALLFFFIALLEDTGYMSRVSFLLDRLMRGFGMNGKSLIPLMSGVACAVPALLSTRTIRNRKERLITIMVTPLMSCSARLPVYTLLVALVIPRDMVMGMSLQGIAMMLLYLIGFLAALAAALIMKYVLHSEERSFFIMELPVYRIPRWKTIFLHILEKVRIFLFDAGKIILAISIVLWVLSSFAPGDTFEQIDHKYESLQATGSVTTDSLQAIIQAEKLEHSYAGMLGHVIEPAIRPLGFDWKIGIALITSFAAREVFVGTMSTIYSVGDERAAERTLREKMAEEKDPSTGLPRYTLAVGLSLLLFYAFAMQCMSTLATVYRETKRMKYPLIQLLYMSGLAYLSSLLVYQLLR
jgi:ferrous iron transport protein B